MCRAPRVPCRPPRRRLVFRRRGASDVRLVPSGHLILAYRPRRAQGDATLRPRQSVGLGVGCGRRAACLVLLFLFALRREKRWPVHTTARRCVLAERRVRRRMYTRSRLVSFFLFRSAPLASTIFRLPTRSTLAFSHTQTTAPQPRRRRRNGCPQQQRRTQPKEDHLPERSIWRTSSSRRAALRRTRRTTTGRAPRRRPACSRRSGPKSARRRTRGRAEHSGRRGPCLIIFAASEGGRRPRSDAVRLSR